VHGRRLRGTEETLPPTTLPGKINMYNRTQIKLDILSSTAITIGILCTW